MIYTYNSMVKFKKYVSSKTILSGVTLYQKEEECC